MRESLFIDGWQFLKTAITTQVKDIDFYSENFIEINLPHDWLIHDTKEFDQSSTGWYRRFLTKQELSESELRFNQGERVYLRFDGVYMDSTIYINREKVMEWKYGYSTFGVDITDYLTESENEILVKVVYQTPNSRWYSGAGIYRNVWLRILPENYLPYDGTYVSMKQEKKDFLLDIETEIITLNNKQNHIEYALYKDGDLIADLGNEQEIQTTKEGVSIAKKKCLIEKPLFWDVVTPNLYELRVLLKDEEGHICDEDKVTVGFRTLEFTTDKGLFLNGKHIKLHGVCEHHDFGCLGACFFEAALRRKFDLLQKMGVNAVRTSHNMPAKEFMDIADEMGILVLSEAFDMWECKKTDYDYSCFFNEWVEKDVRSWIRRDRNHPSLLMWSVGNEIYDTHQGKNGYDTLKKLIGYVREHDSKCNAPITFGSNYMPWENTQKCAELLDVVGYNYWEQYYDKHHKEHPDWIIYGSETGSIVQSRGVYHFPYEQPILSEDDEQCSSLGNSITSWGAESIEKCIADNRDRKYSLGQFLWSGFDYIGEPTPYHTKNSYFGQLDTAGFCKDSYYQYKAEWTDGNTIPMIHLFPYWDFNCGQQIDVRVCSNVQTIELFVNNRSFGVRHLNHKKGCEFTANYLVPYLPGEIRACAYNEAGKVIASDTKHSFRDAVKLSIKPDKLTLKADGCDLCFIEIGANDIDGYPVWNAMNYIEVEVKGNGFLAGLDNGDSTDTDSYKGKVRKLFNGKLLAVIQSKRNCGSCEVTIRGNGLDEKKVVLEVIEAPENKYEALRFGDVIPNLEVSNLESRKMLLQPVRKIGLCSLEGCTLTKNVSETIVEARVFPDDATDQKVIFDAVNDAGIPVDFVTITPLDATGKRMMVKALGNGTFRIRAMSKSGTDKIKIISSLEFLAMGLGPAYINPYKFVYGGVYTETIGKIGSGNEKGFATDSEKESGVIFTELDFGSIGSDVITIPIFALTDDAYQFQIWEGRPSKRSKDRLLLDGIYQKHSIWNTYQEETYHLSKKLTGITDLSFVFHGKVHMKGFQFK